MKRTLSMILCMLMLASCLALSAFAAEETTAEAADQTTAEATEETDATQEAERTNDKIVLNTDLATKPNPVTAGNGMNKGSGISKKGEWDGYKVDVKHPEDPNFAFNYDTYCKKFSLTPLTGEDVSYIVLKVLVPEEGYYDDFEIYYCAGEVSAPTEEAKATSEYCDEANGFVYFLFNVEGAWSGEIKQLRIDPIGMSEDDVLYVMEIALFKTEEDAMAWCDFEEKETEATTEEQTEEPTTEKVTEEESTRDPAVTRPSKDDEGCGGMISVGAIVAIISLGAVCIKKRD